MVINVKAIWQDQAFSAHGKLVMTTYRMFFSPNNSSIYKKLNIPKNFLQIPLGYIAKSFKKSR